MDLNLSGLRRYRITYLIPPSGESSEAEGLRRRVNE
jgi:hypothetical protein